MAHGIDKMYLLGCSWLSLPILFDIAFESRGIRSFCLAKNIRNEGEPVIDFNKGLFTYTVHEPGEQYWLEKGSLFFGVVGPRGKSLVYDYFKDSHHIDHSWFMNLTHPQSYVATSTELDSGILLEPGVIVSSQTRIGFGVTVKRGASIGHHNLVEEYSEINPGAVISGNVHIGRCCTLGAGCVIRDGASIGDNSLIGMGSVVTQDIPAGVIAYGNPCKVIRENEKLTT